MVAAIRLPIKDRNLFEERGEGSDLVAQVLCTVAVPGLTACLGGIGSRQRRRRALFGCNVSHRFWPCSTSGRIKFPCWQNARAHPFSLSLELSYPFAFKPPPLPPPACRCKCRTDFFFAPACRCDFCTGLPVGFSHRLACVRFVPACRCEFRTDLPVIIPVCRCEFRGQAGETLHTQRTPCLRAGEAACRLGVCPAERRG